MAETFAAAVADRRSFRGDSAEAVAVRDRPPPAVRLVPPRRRRTPGARPARPRAAAPDRRRVRARRGARGPRRSCAPASPAAGSAAGRGARGAAAADRRGAPVPEVAAALGIAEPAARARVSRALRGLAEELERENAMADWTTLSASACIRSASSGSARRRRAARATSARPARWLGAGAWRRSRSRPWSRCRSPRRAARRPRSCCARPSSPRPIRRKCPTSRRRWRGRRIVSRAPGGRPRRRPALGDPRREVEDRLHLHDGRAGPGRDLRPRRSRRRLPRLPAELSDACGQGGTLTGARSRRRPTAGRALDRLRRRRPGVHAATLTTATRDRALRSAPAARSSPRCAATPRTHATGRPAALRRRPRGAPRVRDRRPSRPGGGRAWTTERYTLGTRYEVLARAPGAARRTRQPDHAPTVCLALRLQARLGRRRPHAASGRQGRPPASTAGTGRTTPARTVVWGIARNGKTIKAVTVNGAGTLTAVSKQGAFAAVLPASVDPHTLTLDVTLADGTVQHGRPGEGRSRTTSSSRGGRDDRQARAVCRLGGLGDRRDRRARQRHGAAAEARGGGDAAATATPSPTPHAVPTPATSPRCCSTPDPEGGAPWVVRRLQHAGQAHVLRGRRAR